MLEAALAAGIAEAGGDAFLAGVLPTPAASVLVRRHGLDLAAVVSASHNPWEDNGIKFFGPDGRKLEDAAEERIEELVGGSSEAPSAGPRPRPRGSARRLRARADLGLPPRPLGREGDARLRQRRRLPRRAARLRAPRRERRGRSPTSPTAATSTTAAARPTSRCSGSASPDRTPTIGFAFDGDADRVLAVDGNGRVHDGDELIALGARHLRAAGALPGRRGHGDDQLRLPPGDGGRGDRGRDDAGRRPLRDRGAARARLALRRRAVRPHHLDRLRPDRRRHRRRAARAARALDGRDLAEVEPFERLPQRLENLEIPSREALDGATALWEAVDKESAALEGRGRVLVRPSGTEPLVRIMVEAPSEEECDEVLGRLIETARNASAVAGRAERPFGRSSLPASGYGEVVREWLGPCVRWGSHPSRGVALSRRRFPLSRRPPTRSTGRAWISAPATSTARARPRPCSAQALHLPSRLDPAGGRIYWTDPGASAIRVGNLDGTGNSILFGGEASPFAVATDPAANRIYWTGGGAIRVGQPRRHRHRLDPVRRRVGRKRYRRRPRGQPHLLDQGQRLDPHRQPRRLGHRLDPVRRRAGGAQSPSRSTPHPAASTGPISAAARSASPTSTARAPPRPCSAASPAHGVSRSTPRPTASTGPMSAARSASPTSTARAPPRP